MNTYAIEFAGNSGNEVAPSAGKAKYNYFLNHELSDCGFSFGYFLTRVKCKLSHKFHVKDLFTQHVDQFNRMKVSRGIEFAHLGMRVEVNGKPGVIVGSNSSMNLDVCLDGQHWAGNCHPWWRAKYFDNEGNLIREYKD